MDDYKKEVMDITIRFRMKKTEYLFIKEKAEKNHLSVSEYLRRRGLEDPDSLNTRNNDQPYNSKARFACDHDKELMRLVYRSYLYNKEMAKKEFGQEWFNEAEKVATLLMKDWKYE